MMNAGKQFRVSLVKTGKREEGIRKSVELLDINPVQGKKVILKPNFNTADPYPGSTDPETLRELIKYLQELGAEKITIGERSGPVQTSEVMEKLGAYKIAEELGTEIINFDELPAEEMVKVNPPGSHWKNGFEVPRMLRDAECIVASPCLKTHQFGGIFTMALKLAVGIIPKAGTTYMKELHSSPHMGKMIAEINYAYKPCLFIMDGMEAFVKEGPMTGTRKRVDLFMAGTDPVSIDAVGVAILKELGSTPEIMDTAIFKQEQIARAVELGLGAAHPGEIELISGDAESEDYACKIRSILEQG